MYADDERTAATLDFKYADGTIVTYGAKTADLTYGHPDQGRRYPIKITDAQGNYINITYVSGDTEGKLASVQDTMNRYINFGYSGSKLISATVPGFNGSSTPRETIRLFYDTLTFASGTRFSDTQNPTFPATVDVVKYVYFPGTASGFKYDYSPAWGTIYKISSLRGMTVDSTSVTSDGEVAATTEYNYGLTVTTLSDVPTFTTRTDDWLGRTTSSAPVTSFSVVKNTTSGRTESRITAPDGTVQEAWMNLSPGNWDDGLVTDTFIKTTTPSFPDTVWSHTKMFWDDQYGVNGRANPSVIKTEQTNDAGQTKATTFEYDTYNNPTVVKEHDFATAGTLGTELRKTETSYVTGSQWINNNLLHLPQSVKTIVNSTVVSRTDYEYDGETLATYGAGIVQHNERYNPDTPGGETCEMVCPSECQDVVYPWLCNCDRVEVCTPFEIYDGNTAYRGNLTKVTQFVDPTNNSDPNAVVNTMKYDVVGNVVEASMDCCNVMTTEYASANHYAYPTKETKGSSPQLITESTYDFNTGLVTSTEDENDQDTTYTYNSTSLLGTRVDYANGAWKEFEYNLTAYPYSVETTSSLDSTRSISVWSYMNGMGQQFRTRRPSANGYLSSETEFDNMGRVVKTYNPFTVSSLSAAVPSGTKFTEASDIDAMGRILETTYPDLTTRTVSYSGVTAVLTDQAGKQRRQVGDALGRIIRVDEPNSSGGLGTIGSPAQPTYYEFDGNSNITKVTQSDGTNTQERAFKHDALSRLTHERQVEASPTLDADGVKGSPSSTKWTRVHKYNTENLLTETIDARGVKATYAYDELNRVSSVTYTGESGYQTPQLTYTYDEIHSGYYNKGRVTKVKTAAVSVTGQSTPETIQNFDYDKLGQIVNHTQSIGSQSYSLQYTYNLAGQLISETYPSGKAVNSTVDNYGVVQTIADSQRSYLTGLTFNNQGTLSQISLGNGTTESFTYNDRFQMTSQSLQKSSTVLQKYEYSYGTTDLSNGGMDTTKNNGQLGKIEGYIGSTKQWSQRFGYDEIGRLSESREYQSGNNSQLTYKQKFEFDRFGNLYRKSASNPTTGQANPLTYTPIEDSDISKTTNRFTSGLTYNETGQVTADTKFRGMGFLYDANGRLVKATKTSVPDALTVYDALGNRVATKVNDVWQYMIYDALGQLVAEYGSQADGAGGVKFIQQDWQGSVRAITNNNGHIVSRTDHQAFGEEIGVGKGLRSIEQGYAVDSVTTQGYGLTEKDEGTSQQHTWFRKLETQAGRWSSPDPYNGSMNLEDPQTFNRYSYVKNDPTNLVDPSGLTWQICGIVSGEFVCWETSWTSGPAWNASQSYSGNGGVREVPWRVSDGSEGRSRWEDMLYSAWGGFTLKEGGKGNRKGDDELKAAACQAEAYAKYAASVVTALAVWGEDIGQMLTDPAFVAGAMVAILGAFANLPGTVLGGSVAASLRIDITRNPRAFYRFLKSGLKAARQYFRDLAKCKKDYGTWRPPYSGPIQ
jgi:RHS repeat-associated protein